ncbi:hypothetical protein Btru_066452, partial [Bulinus truncatus]
MSCCSRLLYVVLPQAAPCRIAPGCSMSFCPMLLYVVDCPMLLYVVLPHDVLCRVAPGCSMSEVSSTLDLTALTAPSPINYATGPDTKRGYADIMHCLLTSDLGAGLVTYGLCAGLLTYGLCAGLLTYGLCAGMPRKIPLPMRSPVIVLRYLVLGYMYVIRMASYLSSAATLYLLLANILLMTECQGKLIRKRRDRRSTNYGTHGPNMCKVQHVVGSQDKYFTHCVADHLKLICERPT